MKYTELKQKEVVDGKSGKRLGFIVDLDIDPYDGKINEILLPSSVHGFDCLKKQHLICIPFCNILKIGSDIILVKFYGRK